jgi:hypothetical protein
MIESEDKPQFSKYHVNKPAYTYMWYENFHIKTNVMGMCGHSMQRVEM